MSATTIETGSGRLLGMTPYGDPSADRVVILCHPTPGAALDPDPLITEKWGVRLLAVDRPGYDSSDPVPEGDRWTLADHAQDICEFVRRSEQVADSISNARLDRYGVIGWGTGGFVAAAIAAHDPKVDRLALVGVPRPSKRDRFIDRALHESGLASLGIEEEDPDLGRHVGLLRRLERMLDQAHDQGDAGVLRDRELFDHEAWIDQLGSIQADTHIWVGERDPLVADLDARWYADRIDRVQATRVRDSGPLTIAAAWTGILAHVAPDHGSLAEQLRDSGDGRVADLDPREPDLAPFSSEPFVPETPRP